MKKPLSIECSSTVFDIAFHPLSNIICAGTIEGQIDCFTFNEKCEPLFSAHPHQESCRSLDFNADGSGLFTVSKDRSLQLIDIETHKMILRKVKAHSSPINKVRYISENLVATGDDAGCVKIWDIRTRKLSLKFKENQDYISDMYYVGEKNTLLATSGGGCLSVFDVRKDKPIAVSANQDDELLSVVVVKNNKKAVIGTQSGTILLFSWNDWGDCTDRFPGHPMSVSSLCKSNETTVYTGSSDGIIRAVGILPNQLLGTVGDNGDMPIEALKLSSDGKWLASCSHDETVKLWEADITALDNEVFGDELEKDSDDSDYDMPAKKKHKKTKKAIGNERGKASAKAFFEDLD